MSKLTQKERLLRMLRNQETITEDKAMLAGINHPRQQIAFLREKGHVIACVETGTYKLIQEVNDEQFQTV